MITVVADGLWSEIPDHPRTETQPKIISRTPGTLPGSLAGILTCELNRQQKQTRNPSTYLLSRKLIVDGHIAIKKSFFNLADQLTPIIGLTSWYFLKRFNMLKMKKVQVLMMVGSTN